MIGCGNERGIAGGAAVTGAAEIDRFADRFRLWTGRSGRRYVFSRVDGRCDDLDGAVVAIGRETGTGGFSAERILVDGERIAGALPPRAVVFAHFLAESAAARRAVVADLEARPDSGRGVGSR